MWWLLACTDRSTDTASPPDEGIYEGSVADEGYGMRVARAGRRVIVGAPLSGRVYTGERARRWGSDGSFFGAGLAVLDSGSVLIGSPRSNRIVDLDSGAIVVEGEQLGGVIATNGTRWVAATHSGLRWDHGEVEYLGRRPDALALFADGTLVVGYAAGPTALRIGEVVVPRRLAGDDEGYALLVADADGDGDEDVVVGAPGANEVRVYDRTGAPIATVRGDGGRFGAALAYSGALFVGAPMTNDAAGAVYTCMSLGTPTLVAEGRSDDAQLGFALWADDQVLIMGAPEGPDAPGYVKVVAR